MLLIILTIGLFILGLVLSFVAMGSWDHEGIWWTICSMCLVFSLVLGIFGGFHGFINYPATKGTHQGVITAVDLEGVYFRRYEVYLKSSGYTNQSDETKYLIYENEKELAEQLQGAIGKTVKIHYGHDGGYIGWKSCGTYHIKSIEILEQE